MDAKSSKVLKSINPTKIILPILIGLVVMVYLIYNISKELDFEDVVDSIKNAKLHWIFLAIIVLLIRDWGYIVRIRHLTDKKLDWIASLFVIVLWEFASAVTPSVVGGTAVVVFIINKEGIPFGQSLAYVMLTAVLDNMFFVIASLLTFIIVPFEIFPAITDNFTIFGMAVSVKGAFFISVTLIALYTLLMIYGLFVRPRAFKWVLIKLTGNRILKKWRKDAIQWGTEVISASEILLEKKSKYWTKAILSTIFIWSARYLMLNCLIAAFTDINIADHFLIFGRQIVMWIVMLISPTPGSAGTAEFVFPLFFSEFFTIAAFSAVVAIFWRLFTYYAYLGLGVFFLPRWIRRVFVDRKHTEK
ncbi:MAG: flippase-like domain-containing protein [Flammeovirgaceae bacterium]|nr:flippase-like domain-containing protein [Flammeovirgaceae bacterium]